MEHVGRVKWYDESKGYGFISSKDRGDVFLHVSNVPSDLKIREDSIILFEIEETKKGLNAINVKLPQKENRSIRLLDFYNQLYKQLEDSVEEFDINVSYGREKRTEDKYSFENLIGIVKDADFNSLINELLEVTQKNKVIQEHYRVFFYAVKTIIESFTYKQGVQAGQDVLDKFLEFAPNRSLILIWRKREHIISRNNSRYLSDNSAKTSFIFPPDAFGENLDLINSHSAQHFISNEPNSISIVKEIVRMGINSTQINHENIDKIHWKYSSQQVSYEFGVNQAEIEVELSKIWKDKYCEYIQSHSYDAATLKGMVKNDKEHLLEEDQEEIWSNINFRFSEEERILLWKETHYTELEDNLFLKCTDSFTIDDFKYVSESLKEDLFKKEVRNILPIDSIEKFVSVSILYNKYGRLPEELCYEYTTGILLHDRSKEFLKKFKQCGNIDKCKNSYLIHKTISAKIQEGKYDSASITKRSLTDQEAKDLLPLIIDQNLNKDEEFIDAILTLLPENDLVELVENFRIVPENYNSLKNYNSHHYLELMSRIKNKFFVSIDLPSDYLRFLKPFSLQMPTGFYNLVWRTENILPFNKDIFLSELTSQTPFEQALMFKRLFKEIQNENLTREQFHEISSQLVNKIKVDLNIKLCIQLLSKFDSSGLEERTIYDVVASILKEDLNSLLSIDYFFDLCNGRKTYRTSDNQWHEWYVEVLDERFRVSDDYIEVGNEICLLNKGNRTVEIDGQTYSFKWKKDEGYEYLHSYGVPDGIKFCDARFTEKDEATGRLFHWCNNYPCFKANQKDHAPFDWESFTLRDFVQILGYQIDHDQYYRFLGALNRADRLLKKLKCQCCGNLLRDTKSSGFAYYRVTTFKCVNPECEDCISENKVYLTHCLNSKCYNIVDSRISKRCSNGWTICDRCDCCCSQKKIKSRYENLKINNYCDLSNPQHQRLEHQFINNLGHLERQEFFDYKTGERRIGQVEPRKVKDKPDSDDLPF